MLLSKLVTVNITKMEYMSNEVESPASQMSVNKILFNWVIKFSIAASGLLGYWIVLSLLKGVTKYATGWNSHRFGFSDSSIVL